MTAPKPLRWKSRPRSGMTKTTLGRPARRRRIDRNDKGVCRISWGKITRIRAMPLTGRRRHSIIARLNAAIFSSPLASPSQARSFFDRRSRPRCRRFRANVQRIKDRADQLARPFRLSNNQDWCERVGQTSRRFLDRATSYRRKRQGLVARRAEVKFRQQQEIHGRRPQQQTVLGQIRRNCIK